MKSRKFVLLGMILAFLDAGIPYLFLRNIARFWASYLYWVVLTSITIVLGIRYVQNWGE